jgi:predicted ArsR family transcriptional regulator
MEFRLMPRKRIWTEAKDAELIVFHTSGLSYAAIAGNLGVSTNAAAARITTLIRRDVLKARRGKWTKVGDHSDWLCRSG